MATHSGAFAPQNGLPNYFSGLETTSIGGFCSLDSPDTTLAGVGLEPTASGLWARRAANCSTLRRLPLRIYRMDWNVSTPASIYFTSFLILYMKRNNKNTLMFILIAKRSIKQKRV